MARIYEFAEFTIERKADNHGWTTSFAGQEKKECLHRHLLFDENGHTVECQDCGKEVSAWWAFISIAERFHHEWEKLNCAKTALAEAEKRALTHKAAILVEDAWRRRNAIPTCPHCSKPILPCDRFGAGSSSRIFCEKNAKLMQLKPGLTIVESEETEE
jgi:ribosomal protein S27E